MSVRYRAIYWNRLKRIYDLVLMSGLAVYLIVFLSVAAATNPHLKAETLLIRAFGTAALLLLHIVLCIGPLCRLDRRFLPLLYNRRHLGVVTFVLAASHASLAVFHFYGFSNGDPLVSIFVSNQQYFSVRHFPFQTLGFFALLILFLMAATSHDFWLRNLTAPTWKRLHMLVYVAYVLLIAHVSFGALQSRQDPLLAGFLMIGVATVVTLHLLAADRERRIDRMRLQLGADGYVQVCDVDRIPENRAVIVSVSGERVAVFRYDGKISAVSNVCQHQNGPLGEGRIIGGCITCPWHGYQYMPHNGASPLPFKECVPTFRTRVIDGKVWLDPRPLPAGTPVEPAVIAMDAHA